MKIFQLSFLSLFFAGGLFAQTNAPIAKPLEFISQNFNVLKYEAQIEFPAFPTTQLSGVCKIIFKYERAPNENPFYFHLRDLNIDSVFFNKTRTSAIASGVPADSTYHWEVSPIGALNLGDTASVTVYYHGLATNVGWGGVEADKNYLYALGVGFSNNYVSATQHWLPCYDHPSDKATFSCLFTVADSLCVASNGKLTDFDTNAGKISYLWETDIPTATYLLTFAIGKYKPYQIADSAHKIYVYALAKDSAKIYRNFKNVPKMLKAFESRFIEYPFEKVGYAMTTQGSMEHQTMISYAYSLINTSDTINSTAAHELSHQWFGDLVSPIDFRHAWLNESYATFCEAIYQEYLFGESSYLSTLAYKRNYYFKTLVPSEGVLPLYDYPRNGKSSNYPETIYQKGAVIVGMLRSELGDSIFFGATKEYLTKFALKSVPTDSLITVYENYSGRDLKWFFEQWVYRAGYPIFSIDYNKNSQFIKVSSDAAYGAFINVPLEYSYTNANGELITKIARINVVNGVSAPVYLDAETYAVTFDACKKICPLIKISSTTNVAESEKSNFEIFPNPADNEITIKFDENYYSEKFRIFDILGAVYNCETSRVDGVSISLNVKNLPQGEYYIEFSEAKTGVAKFVKK